MVIRPYGYALWENIQSFLDSLIKDRGVKNAYFPLFIPMHYLQKEKEHVEGFAPELAIVTIGGGEKLAEELAVRPTSETIMYDMFRKWTSSWRDLPLLINQWCNVVRWEKRTYMFLRTTEFLWQEGHCAHLTHEESLDTVNWAINAYKKTCNELMAIYGIVGTKSETEKFAGAETTYTFESLMPNGKSLQTCTSHDLGQNFSKSFEWSVQGKNNEKVYPWQNSWGFSTRTIGALIMSHGDKEGLVLPPNIAPTQIVIVPFPGHDKAVSYADTLFENLKSKFRVEIDCSEGESAGFKFNKWELKGVPLRLEIGNKETDSGEVTIFRRDTGEKQKIKSDELVGVLSRLLAEIQLNLFNKHRKFTEDHTFEANTYEEFKKIMETTKGFIKAFWCEDSKCEAEIKAETKATTRCLPMDFKNEVGVCVHCGKESHHRWLFGQSY
jgi:prolyl-tRNA synthetase